MTPHCQWHWHWQALPLAAPGSDVQWRGTVGHRRPGRQRTVTGSHRGPAGPQALRHGLLVLLPLLHYRQNRDAA